MSNKHEEGSKWSRGKDGQWQREEWTRVSKRTRDHLKVGSVIKVQRSSGQVESGWRISSFKDGGNIAVVEKNEGAKILQKMLRIEDLEVLNPPKDLPADPEH